MNSKVYSIDEIRQIVAPIAKRYGAERIYLFGSYARGTASPESDVDLRVDKGAIKGMFALSGFRLDLLDHLGKNIDLLTTGSLDDEFLDEIHDEEVLIYG
ncbi:MAG: nucleotidyltransferase domain-containing protein [Oscillospiraceae bacterium]|nr:nucleotidyltransferase domain-containing protein [Oscillospiraceae bacterium]